MTSCANGLGSAGAPAEDVPIAWDQAYLDATEAYERGDYATSAELARTAHSAARAATGADSWETGSMLSLLAAAQLALGNYPEAATAFEASLATLRRSPDPEAYADITTALANLGELYRQQGQLERALPYYEEAYRTSEENLGPDHADTAHALAALALIRHESGALEQAATDYDSALRRMADAGITPLEQVNVRANQADLLMRTGRQDEAQAALEEILATQLAHLPPGHPHLAYTLNALGVLADAQEHYEDALLLYQRALMIRRNALPDGHPAIARVLANMAGTHADMANIADARASYLQAISILQAAHGNDHPDIAEYEDALRELSTGSPP